MQEKVYCPYCSKVSKVEIPGKYECKDCSTKFEVNLNCNTKVLQRGKSKIVLTLENLLLTPLIFLSFLLILFISKEHTETFKLCLSSIILIGHPIFYLVKEIKWKVRDGEIFTIELYLAFFRKELKKYGYQMEIYFYSSFALWFLGFLILPFCFI